jgi:hypothetical protein
MSRRLGARPAPAQPPASALAHAIQEAIGDAGRPSPEALEIERDLLALVVSDPAGAAMDPRYLRPLGRRMTTRLADAVAQLVEDEAYRTIDSIRALRAAGDPDAANWLDPDDSTTWETGKPGWR